jgi:A/G-specific adenine glycosylase
MVEAHPATVNAALRPLGLKWRARNIRQAARLVLDEFAGAVPCEPEALKRLPGVGPYVAGAVAASISRRPALLIDVNTVRVATRVAGINPEGDVRRRRDVVRAVEGLLGGTASAANWWAVLDLAALVCKADTPHCSECPLVELCKRGEAEASETHV